MAFDQEINTYYRFDEAEVILSLDADFLFSMPGSLRYTRDFMARHTVRENADQASMSRLYMVESAPTLTGAKADNHLKMRASEVEGFARALAVALGVAGVEASTTRWNDNPWLAALVQDLQASGSRALVVPGDEQPAVVHALAHAINNLLASEAVVYTEPIEVSPVTENENIALLVQEINNRNVDALFILSGNPAYDAPADLDFASTLANVAFSAHLSLYYDETSRLVQWHLPATTFIEAWGDARAYDGSLSVMQPPIGPLYPQAHSAHDVLAALMGDERTGYQLVRATWQGLYDGEDFEAYWRRALHNGVAENSALPAISPSLRSDLAGQFATLATTEPAAGLELVFRPSPTLYDGRFGYNSWLQELPHPLTKVSWDNTAIMSVATANDLEVETGDLVELSVNNASVRVPAFVLPGVADNVVTVYLGYGRGISADLDEDLDFNVYPLRTLAAFWFAPGLQVRNTGEDYKLAVVRSRIDPEQLDRGYSDLPVRAGTLAEFRENPTFAAGEYKVDPNLAIFPVQEGEGGYAWGMTIDLTACIGCNACIIACQSENNIPAVGKENVAKGREMYWLRVDRYYLEHEDGSVTTSFQPVPCMQCETAPCEIVCPVQATIHDTEGINNMIYNRCIGTRYCSANCPYSVRRFNFQRYVQDEDILIEQRNPNVSVRPEGVMEKCTYCQQRINAARINARNENRLIGDGEVMTACQSACPARAISFGNLNDPDAQVVALKAQPLNYGLLEELGTRPRTTYLARLSNPNAALYSPVEEA
ncbi:MAG: 4Fe-4S dicluster domain-containing protein [Anaerolineae bacterium]|nr:4Fe-4S dicluster domain-containing protein [Anaerolineae bacterium]